MAESPTNDQSASGNGAASGDPAANQRQFGLRQLYVKDLSFEAPNSPGILTEGGLEPEIKLNLRTSQRDLGNDILEVVLHVSVHALAGQRTVFLVELEQAGTFLISGFSTGRGPRDHRHCLSRTHCFPTPAKPSRRSYSAAALRSFCCSRSISQHSLPRHSRNAPTGQPVRRRRATRSRTRVFAG